MGLGLCTEIPTFLPIVFGITLMAVLGVCSMTPAVPQITRSQGLSSLAVANPVMVFTQPGVVLMPVLDILADRWR